MNPKFELAGIDVLVLCGGLGTRLRPVIHEQPKSLAPIGGRPFLDLLVDELLDSGFRRVIFCVGHFKEQIIKHFKDRQGGNFLFSEEETPLGTGGAIKNAETLIRSETLFILNGDSLCRVNFQDFYQFHVKQEAFLSMVLSPSKDATDYGNVELDTTGKIQAFHEKRSKGGNALINGGMYLISKEGLSLMPKKLHFSLEYDFYPKILKVKRCLGYVVEHPVFDIGTPDRYHQVNQMFVE